MRNGFLILSSKCSAVLCCISAKSLPRATSLFRNFSFLLSSTTRKSLPCPRLRRRWGTRRRPRAVGRAARKSGLRHALERAGGPAEGDGLHHAERFGSSSANSRGDGGQSDEDFGAPHAR